MTANTTDPAVALHAVGLRVTAPRLAVLEALGHDAHLTAEDLTTRVRERLGRVSAQAVYDVLRATCDAGLVRRIEPAGAASARYERHTDNHHLVCRSCGRIEDVACAVGVAPCLEPVTSRGFVLDEAEVTYWGLCPACQSEHPRKGSL